MRYIYILTFSSTVFSWFLSPGFHLFLDWHRNYHNNLFEIIDKSTAGLVLLRSALPINPPNCEQAPVPWWDKDADRSLLVGTFKHGYESYPQMRSDPALSFLARCGPMTPTHNQM